MRYADGETYLESMDMLSPMEGHEVDFKREMLYVMKDEAIGCVVLAFTEHLILSTINKNKDN